MIDPIQFALAVLLLLAAPGPTNTVMALAGAINRDERPWLFLLAALVGYLAIVLLARAVLLPLTDAYPWTGVALKIVVVFYLVYAAIRLWRTPIAGEVNSSRITPQLVALTTFLTTKGLIFAIAIFPREHPALLGYFVAFGVLVLIVASGWFLAGRTLGVLAGRHASLLPRVGSVALVGFAGYLVASVI